MGKFLVIFFLCVVNTLLVKCTKDKEEMHKKAAEYFEQCKKEVGVTQSVVDDWINKEPLSTQSAMCFGACIMKKYKMMDDKGKFAKTGALDHIRAAADDNEPVFKKAAEIIEICGAITLPPDHCEAAKELMECFDENGANELDF